MSTTKYGAEKSTDRARSAVIVTCAIDTSKGFAPAVKTRANGTSTSRSCRPSRRASARARSISNPLALLTTPFWTEPSARPIVPMSTPTVRAPGTFVGSAAARSTEPAAGVASAAATSSGNRIG